MATCNLGQAFNFEFACKTCGAGATPRSPLFIDSNRLGKKALDATAHDLRIVVRSALADSLVEEGLTGFVIGPVVHKTETRIRPIPEVRWLEPTFEWPPFHPSSIVAREDQCPACRRSGHFDSPSPETSLRYECAPSGATDFGATYEYFGRWRAPGKSGPDVGGGRLTIISDRFRRALVAEKVRHVSFEPIDLSWRDA